MTPDLARDLQCLLQVHFRLLMITLLHCDVPQVVQGRTDQITMLHPARDLQGFLRVRRGLAIFPAFRRYFAQVPQQHRHRVTVSDLACVLQRLQGVGISLSVVSPRVGNRPAIHQRFTQPFAIPCLARQRQPFLQARFCLVIVPIFPCVRSHSSSDAVPAQ